MEPVADMGVVVRLNPPGQVERDPAHQALEQLVAGIEGGDDMADARPALQAREHALLKAEQEVAVLHEPIVRLVGDDADRPPVLLAQQVLERRPHGGALPLVPVVDEVAFSADQVRGHGGVRGEALDGERLEVAHEALYPVLVAAQPVEEELRQLLRPGHEHALDARHLGQGAALVVARAARGEEARHAAHRLLLTGRAAPPVAQAAHHGRVDPERLGQLPVRRAGQIHDEDELLVELHAPPLSTVAPPEEARSKTICHHN